MTSGVFLSVVLPAYNEAQSIASTLAAMRTFLDRQEYPYEIIVTIAGVSSSPSAATMIS